MSSLYKLLQSGFIAEDSSDLIQIPEEERTIVQSVISQSLFRPDTSNFYDKGITQLYHHMAAEPSSFRDFQFREVLLKKMFALFGESGFMVWARAQAASSSFSYLHERFLKETVLFVYDSKPRTVSNSSYFRMLHAGKGNALYAASDRGEEGDSLEKVLSSVSNALTVDLVSRWTESVDGFQDMLATLNVIYGRRTSASS